MTRYLVGLLVGSVGTLLGVYAFMALLPATREEKPRDPLPERTVGSYTYYGNGPGTYGTWTTGPLT